jgi:hypothetical protein
MSEQFIHDSESLIDRLLHDLGQKGDFDTFDDSTLDSFMTEVQSIRVSEQFRARALAAMVEAQQKREQHSPALALGMLVAQARQRIGQDINVVAQEVGMPEDTLYEFEQGMLSLREIIMHIPVTTAARLIAQLNIARHQFSHLLLKLAEGGTAARPVAARIIDRRRPSSPGSIEQVANYIAAIEQLLQSS